MKYVIINGRYAEYEVYETRKVKEDDTSCMNQDTKNSKIVTLVTCDSINNNIRYIVKAREIK